ncbi:hypothetical protein K4K55_002436 [Colletotrichum sp. SAR 10_96]|nr:hypothetical protein K4K55_002436 [Colletotrichum sp. SAR 10_96]
MEDLPPGSHLDTATVSDPTQNANPRRKQSITSNNASGTLLTPVAAGPIGEGAIIGGLVSFRGQLMSLTAQHLVETVTPTDVNVSTNDNSLDEESDDCEITGFSDFENDDDEPDPTDITSRGSISPQSGTAVSAVLADKAANIFSRPAQAEPANELGSRLQEVVSSATPVPSVDQHSGATATREVVSSKELGFALVEVSPSALSQLDEGEIQAQAVPLECYVDYIESAPCDAAVEVATSEGRIIEGALDGTLSLLRPPGSSTFIEVYTAWLNRPINPSECGSWLRNVTSRKIYGHVVILGSRPTRRAMIVPAHQVLRQALKILEQSNMEKHEDQSGRL